MSSQLPNPASRRSQRAPLHKVVTHHNGLVFHCVAVASFLESTAPLHAAALGALPALGPEACRRLDQEWSPGKAARGRALRAYVEAAWPGFDWACAFAEFYESYRPRAAHAYAARPVAQAALALCATAAQTAAFYRGLAAYADDPELRQLLRGMSEDEARNFDWLRALFEHLDRGQPMRAIETYRTIVRSARDARDGAVRLAHARIAENWCERPPFPDMAYSVFIARAGGVLERYLTLDVVQRVLFRPWLKARDVPVLDAPRSRQGERPAAAPRLLAAA